jgi:DNA-binding CsgD family transcriptional regulator
MSRLCPPVPASASPEPASREAPPAPRQALNESHLTESELRVALDVLHAIGEACCGSADFARRVVEWLPRLVGAELTTLSVCDLDSGRRSVVSDAPGAISPSELEAFDRHFFDHPLVREHGRNPAAVAKRITDVVPEGEFRRTPLYNEYYRRIGIEHVTAVPIHVDRRFLVSFVLNRAAAAFSDRERELLELVRPHLANLYRLSVAIDRADATPAGGWDTAPLTPREREVLDWVAAGKTNRDVAAILGASPRTVEKHLERIYEKLGVETRTAAVMRAIKLARPDA